MFRPSRLTARKLCDKGSGVLEVGWQRGGRSWWLLLRWHLLLVLVLALATVLMGLRWVCMVGVDRLASSRRPRVIRRGRRSGWVLDLARVGPRGPVRGVLLLARCLRVGILRLLGILWLR